MADPIQPPPPVDTDAEMNDDLDAGIEADLNNQGTQQPEAMNVDGATEAEPPQRNGVAENHVEARIPAKKDATLREFMSKMDDFAPIVQPAPPPFQRITHPSCRFQTLLPITT